MVSFCVSTVWLIMLLCTGFNSAHTVKCSFDQRCRCQPIRNINHYATDCAALKLTRIPAIPNNIEIIDFSRNIIQQIPDSHFKYNSALQKLILSHNNLQRLSTDSFKGLINVTFLTVDNNRLTSVAVQSFTNLTKLQYLNLKNNKIDVTMTIFNLPSSLHVLKMDVFGNTTSILEERLPGLRTLDISGLSGRCELKTLTNKTFTFLQRLEHLDISSCQINHVYKGTFSNLIHLSYLDVSFNTCLKFKGVETIINDLPFTSIKILKMIKVHKTFDMNTKIMKSHMKGLKKTNLREVYMDSNRIQQIEKGAISMIPKTLLKASVTDNQFSFGIYLLETLSLSVHFLNVSELYKAHQYTSEEEKCGPVDNENYVHKYDPSMEPVNRLRALFTSISFSCPQNLTTLIFRNSFLRYEIPTINFGKNNLQYIDVSSTGFNVWTGPLLQLEKLYFLDLSNNLCTNISTVFLKGFPNLKNLSVQNNLLGLVLPDDVNGDTFRHVRKLEELNIAYNRIPNLRRNFFKYQIKLKRLLIGGNMLDDIGVNFSHMKQLSYLDLSNNRFSYFAIKTRNELDSIPGLTIDMSGNPFECTCNTINFIKWMISVKSRLQKLSVYRCKTYTGDKISLSDPNRVYQILQKQCSSYTSLIIGTIAVLVVFVSILISGIVYRYRWRLRYMYYMTKNKYKGNRSPVLHANEQIYENDAFISYEDKDRIFVHDKMLHQLEDEAGLKLCLHKRDFLPGNDIAENITSAIHKSRKMVVVMSHNYLNSYWCMFEYNMARVESIYSRNKENILFLVFLEHISSSELPLIVLELIQSQSYIEYPNDEYGDTVFWDKLKEVLI